MGYSGRFSGWQSITLEDLVVAYRKAKADCFFENTFPTAIKFAEYESNFLDNLSNLLTILRDGDFSKENNLIGQLRILPKKLTIDPIPNINKGHVHFSNARRAFESLTENNKLTPEFRVIGDFPVDSHIISALWINMIGHKFDAKLDDSCYGARLKRVINDDSLDKDAVRPFHHSAIGSFLPYFQPYQKWRNDGLMAIRHELEKDRNIIAVSLDLKSYYHFIDPQAISSPELHKNMGIHLSPEEVDFTSKLADFLTTWSARARDMVGQFSPDGPPISGGLVIGLTASRIISNVLLHSWDIRIKEDLTPLHYGRYVDDMFLVLQDTGEIDCSDALMTYLGNRLGGRTLTKASTEHSDDQFLWQINLGKEIIGETAIQLQSDKQKLFLLQGQSGFDLLDSIEKEISELSSEHRLMPSPDQLDSSIAAQVLSAAGNVSENADTLRRADGLTIRRLSWSLQLRHVETLAYDLPKGEWKKQRMEFYQFAHDHILRPDNIFAHFTYLSRLLGFAISMDEWMEAEKIILASYKALDQLEKAAGPDPKISINGTEVIVDGRIWRQVKGSLTLLFIEAAAKYYDPDKLLSGEHSPRERRLSQLFLDGIFEQLTELEDILEFRFDETEFYHKAPLVALADLAKTPYKKILSSTACSDLISKRNRKKDHEIVQILQNSRLVDTETLKEFLKNTTPTRLASVAKGKRSGESLLPYMFPTRPLTPLEISELAPECTVHFYANGRWCAEKPSIMWARYTQALRGVWIKPTLLATQQDHSSRKPPPDKWSSIHIGTDNKKKVIVALTSLLTQEEEWERSASGKSNLSKERYRRITELVNQAIKLRPKPDYVLFPELSIPIKWLDSIQSRLLSAGISLIAGTEYRHFENDQLFSEACLVLTDNRLGFPANVRIWQAKQQPAVGEDESLTRMHGKKWAETKITDKRRRVYVHNNFCFGVMVCSELQNSEARVGFQGKVDALMVLSWNQDLDTFSALVEASALDIHAYTILVNNRKYGDSRVRAPAKEAFLRDLARVRGGKNDFIIAAELDIEELRAFQSRAKRWPKKSDKFKPIPEGFKLESIRKRLPPR